ncbi:EscU/YscU/HrcU family type III secretion system export apparatus switch protein [Paludicola sp. MB14-C6]|uniref:EscU/YscU/HrcU family type III secretion system export apparatus switch protein n=1 Tax=Paludihabitans sp. MB14-C6 TaxID=3070656 RepID=UPI0027DDCCF8|nr:EscU/YscU/HrcU family type III secretion system export apparatus switch protein [Paludicola sp. MB14-C6]WMJ21904.1 EscU/YscU/HrcU family type III secretion system export apparatus switch protein [Paludicola sp. MB14-C6]
MLPSKSANRATALKYAMEKENSAPVVVASGLGCVAQKIVDVAIENHVPVYEDDSLSALLSQLEVGAQIPDELYQAIVDIYVYFLNFTIKPEEIPNK